MIVQYNHPVGMIICMVFKTFTVMATPLLWLWFELPNMNGEGGTWALQTPNSKALVTNEGQWVNQESVF
jgi:hypothetical protein